MVAVMIPTKADFVISALPPLMIAVRVVWTHRE